MRRPTSATIIATVFLFVFVTAPVLADCSVDIKNVEGQIQSGGGSKSAAGEARAARNLLKKAKAALAEGKKKKCENLVKKAQETLGLN